MELAAYGRRRHLSNVEAGWLAAARVPGYDPETKLLLVSPPAMPTIPEAPTKEEAEVSLGHCSMRCSMNSPSSIRLSLGGPIDAADERGRGAMMCAPAHVATAPEAGTGKSLPDRSRLDHRHWPSGVRSLRPDARRGNREATRRATDQGPATGVARQRQRPHGGDLLMSDDHAANGRGARLGIVQASLGDQSLRHSSSMAIMCRWSVTWSAA